MKTKTPQAFPQITKLNNSTRMQNDPDYYVESTSGMTLRDYFAGQALIALIKEAPYDSIGGDAYYLADQMLKAREDNEQEG